jgi:hypothetical protein
VVRDGFFCHLVKHRSNVTADMGLQGTGHAIVCRLGGTGVIGPTCLLVGVCRHAPEGLLFVVSIHSGSLPA